MSETALELIRRQIREAEERLKKSGKESVANPSDRNARSSAESAFSSSPAIRQLQFLQRNFSTFLESSKNAVVLMDRKGEWELVNYRLPEWLGYANEEFQKLSVSNVFEPEDAKKLFEFLPQWLDAETSIPPSHFNLRSKGGEQIPVLISSHSWLNERGERVACLVIEDMQSRRAESPIGDAKALIEAIIRGGTIPFILLRRDGVIMEANKAASRWLGIGTEKLLTTRLNKYVSPSSRKDFDLLLRRAMQLQPAVETDCKFRRGGGAEFAARISMAGIPDERGVVYRVVGMLDHIETESPIAEPSNEWSAYGQMTPGLLSEISSFIADSVRNTSEQIRTYNPAWASEPAVTRLLQSIDRVRFLLARWTESAEFLGSPPFECNYPDLVRQALNTRKAELQRWGIEAHLEDSTVGMDRYSCPPALFQVILHIMQSCIEQLRECVSACRLSIRMQNPGERLETTFLCEFSSLPESAGASETGSTPYESLRSRNVELRAAQRLLDTMGGTLVLENISETQRAIRMNLSLSALAAGRNLHEQSQV